MNEQLEELTVRDMITKLEQAQKLLADVYHEASGCGLTEIESQMSCADSCIGESLDALYRIEK